MVLPNHFAASAGSSTGLQDGSANKEFRGGCRLVSVAGARGLLDIVVRTRITEGRDCVLPRDLAVAAGNGRRGGANGAVARSDLSVFRPGQSRARRLQPDRVLRVIGH